MYIIFSLILYTNNSRTLDRTLDQDNDDELSRLLNVIKRLRFCYYNNVTYLSESVINNVVNTILHKRIL